MLLHMECICWYCWMWQIAVLWCYVEGVITVKVAATPTRCNHIDDLLSIADFDY